jgi:probable HAF family extracellular repeat protein
MMNLTRSNLLLNCLLLVLMPTVIAATQYSIRPLESFSDQIDVFALGVNDSRRVAGHITDSAGLIHAAAWDANGAKLLPPLVDGRPSWAFRINNRNQIVGKAVTADGNIHAVMWDNDVIRDLGALPGGQNSFAQDINELGVVVGSSEASIGSHAFMWTPDNGFTAFPGSDPPLRLGVAGFNGINDDGLAVGTTYVLLEPFRASLGRPGDRFVTDISPPGRTLGMALAVNNGGTIVGYQADAGQSPQAAIFRGDGTFQSLGTLGLDESWAQDVNDSGTIVGRAFSITNEGFIQRAFVYENGEMRDLLRVSDGAEDWIELFGATSINSAGVIVGEGNYQGELRGFMAVPVPEATCHVAVALGLALCLLSSRPGWR